jgi:hypothetical protein
VCVCVCVQRCSIAPTCVCAVAQQMYREGDTVECVVRSNVALPSRPHDETAAYVLCGARQCVVLARDRLQVRTLTRTPSVLTDASCQMLWRTDWAGVRSVIVGLQRQHVSVETRAGERVCLLLRSRALTAAATHHIAAAIDGAMRHAIRCAQRVGHVYAVHFYVL